MCFVFPSLITTTTFDIVLRLLPPTFITISPLFVRFPSISNYNLPTAMKLRLSPQTINSLSTPAKYVQQKTTPS